MSPISRAPTMLLLASSLLACTSKGIDDSAAIVRTETATLTLAALSPTELRATVGMVDEGVVTCGAVTADVPAGGGEVYVAGVEAGATVECEATSTTEVSPTASATTAAAESPGLVIFDNAHSEQSGNADWVIDDNMPTPSPATPGSAEDWTGAYSSFGYDLLRLGYTLSTNTRSLTADTLEDAQVLVLAEANSRFSSDELAAVAAFVQRGGGILLISNHHESDRDYDGVEPTEVADDVLEAVGAEVRQASAALDTDQDFNTTASYGSPGDPVLHGRSGDVAQLNMYAASAFEVTGLPSDRAVMWLNGHAPDDAFGVRIAAAYVSDGRVLCVPDSAAADDGTGNPGNDAMYNAWIERDNAALFLNAVDWAAGVR